MDTPRPPGRGRPPRAIPLDGRIRQAYLTLAKQLVSAVHSVLGSTRDGSARLPHATDAEPLKGGLRIGKAEEHGSDGDGQYHHYLTLWMFALDRLALATGERKYSELAVQLARAVHPHFVVRRNGEAVRMVWKVSMDMGTALVPSEGHLDAATGFVVYRLLQRTAGRLQGVEGVLEGEIGDYRHLMSREGRLHASRDPLDLGMGLWMSHFFREEEWAATLGSQSLGMARAVLDEKNGLVSRDASRRLAFREFGTCLGLECYGVDEGLKKSVDAVVDFWHHYLEDSTDEDLRPISLVMYAAALIPGVDTLAVHDNLTIEAFLVDVSNPGEIAANSGLRDLLERILQAGATGMGLNLRIQSVPKLVPVFPPEIVQQTLWN
ncbi:hypothetical protein N0V88_001659 [Collariella sp. IMI 366227]|nr:hypothetical protein N0V88_001659 [Collariella sp. IMI 366227]